MSYNIEYPNKEIPFLFEEAKEKLDKIEREANEKKKDIVIKLTKDLEIEIPKDIICQAIVEQLDGRVSRNLYQIA